MFAATWFLIAIVLATSAVILRAHFRAIAMPAR
jgi:hypothetical protein